MSWLRSDCYCPIDEPMNEKEKRFLMDFTNLKEGKGYVTRDEIHARLYHLELPEGEAFFMRRSEDHPLFSDVGFIYKGSYLSIFQVFTGHRDLYYFILDMFFDVVEELNLPMKAEEWN